MSGRNASLLDLDDCCLARILFFTDHRTFKSLTLTCQRLNRASRHRLCWSKQLLQRKIYVQFVDLIIDCVRNGEDISNVRHDLKNMLKELFGLCVKCCFVNVLKKSMYAATSPAAKLVEFLRKACRIVPGDDSYELRTSLEFVSLTGRRIQFEQFPKVHVRMCTLDGKWTSWASIDTLRHYATQEEIYTSLLSEFNALQLPCRLDEVSPVLDLCKRMFDTDGRSGVKCIVLTSGNKDQCQTASLSADACEALENLQEHFKYLIKSQKSLNTVNFLKSIQLYSSWFAIELLMPFLKQLMVVTPIYFKLLSYGRKHELCSWIRYMLLKVDLHSRQGLPEERVRFLMSDNGYIRLRASRHCWYFHLVSVEGKEQLIAQIDNLKGKSEQLKILHDICNKHFVFDLTDAKHNSIPNPPLTMVKFFFANFLIRKPTFLGREIIL